MKRSCRATPNHMSSTSVTMAPSTSTLITTTAATGGAPLKEDSTHSKCSSYSPLSQSSSATPECTSNALLVASGGGGVGSGSVNAPNLSPCTTTPVPAPAELWSVARLTAVANASTLVEHSIQQHPNPHHGLAQLNGCGYYPGENLIIHSNNNNGHNNSNNTKGASSGSSVSPGPMSPSIYGHHHHHGSSAAAVAAIQKPIATFYRHELAKQFHLYRTHHSHHHHHHHSPVQPSPGEGIAAPSPNGVV